ncbi:MAG TPA: hypothetical protein VKV26_09120 [Dehalococcoidia bacterium]|nr:hypothetical protein [Dehalococcoidia bacterium]
MADKVCKLAGARLVAGVLTAAALALLAAFAPANRGGTPAAHAHRAQATPSAAGQEHSFAVSDTGTTLTVGVGDLIALRFGAVRGLSLSGPDPAVLSPLPGPSSDTALFAAAAPGSTTIDATGGPPCPGPICPAIAFVFKVTIVVMVTPPPALTVTYQPGWNLVSMPPTGRLPVDAFAWDADKGAYTRVAAGDPLLPGHGYWATFDRQTTLALPDATHDVVQLGGPAGAWLLAGDPDGVAPAAISGDGGAFAWDAAAQRYVSTSSIQPGTGAWVLAESGLVSVGGPRR